MNRFPDFNKWHKVPKGADIPAQTPYFTARGDDIVAHIAEGWSTKYPAEDRIPDLDYYTEEPIPSPEEEAVEKRARDMFYTAGGTCWEYIGEYAQECWLNLAKKYVEKED